jgi:threonine dehydrogenase-like Zn-dependent dehydrogenase
MPLGANVLVTGLGVLGLLLVQLTRRAGAACVVGVDPHEHRRALALRTGADHVLEPSAEVPAAVRDVTGGLGADVVFEASGSPAGLNEAIRSTADNGLVMAVSWYRGPLDGVDLRGEFHHRRIRIESTEYDLPPFLGPAWSLGRLNALAFDILEDLRLDGFVTHRFPFERAAQAYRCVDERQDGLVQCVLEYGAAA